MNSELEKLKNKNGEKINLDLLDNLATFYIKNKNILYILNENYSVIRMPNIDKLNSIIQVKPDEFIFIRRKNRLKYTFEHIKYMKDKKELKFFIECFSDNSTKKIPAKKLENNIFLFINKENKTIVYDTKDYKRFDFKNAKFVLYNEEQKNIVLEQTIIFHNLPYTFSLCFNLNSFTFSDKIFSKDKQTFFSMLKKEDVKDMYKGSFKLDNSTLLDLSYINFLESSVITPTKKLSLKLDN